MPESIQPTILPVPGSPTYLTALLSSIQTLHPTLPVDPVVLQSLLLSLISRLPKPLSSSAEVAAQNAGSGSIQTGQTSLRFPSTCANLILRTREEDVAVLLHIVSLVSKFVSSVHTCSRRQGRTSHGIAALLQRIIRKPAVMMMLTSGAASLTDYT